MADLGSSGECSGTALAMAHLPTAGLLVQDTYGRTLLIKLAVFAAALVLAAASRRRDDRRRWWRLEAWCLAVVLGLAALLITLPPPA